MPLAWLVLSAALLPHPGTTQPSWWSCQTQGEAFGGEYEIPGNTLSLTLTPQKNQTLTAFISNKTLVDIAFWGKEKNETVKLEGDTHFWRDHVFLSLKRNQTTLSGTLKGVERDGETPWALSLNCNKLEEDPASKRSPDATFADCYQAWGEVLVLLQNIHSFRGQHPPNLSSILDHKLSHNHLKVWATTSCQDWTVQLKMKDKKPLYYISASPKGMPICRLVADAEREEVGPVGDCPKLPEEPPENSHHHGGHE